MVLVVSQVKVGFTTSQLSGLLKSTDIALKAHPTATATMKKDGLKDAMKASHLKIIDTEKVKPNAMILSKSGGGDSDEVELEVEPPRTVSETRKMTENPRGMPKSGRVWKRIKTQR